MNERRLLVISSRTCDVSCKCITWSDRFPYVADFDVVVVDLTSLRQETLGEICDMRKPNDTYPSEGSPLGGEIVTNRLTESRPDFYELLRSGGDVYCIVAEILESDSRYALREGGSKPIYSSVDWSPIHFRLQSKSGDTLAISDEHLREYMTHVSRWSAIISPDPDDSYVQERVCGPRIIPIPPLSELGMHSLDVQPVATNRAGNLVSATIMWRATSLTGHETYRSGALVILPPPTSITVEEALSLLVQKLSGKTESLAPDWMEAYAVPEEHMHRGEMQVTRARLLDLESATSQAAR